MKKILFNDKYGLTKAVLERRKTQTRRLVPKDFFTLAWDKREDTLVYENEEGDFIDIRDSKYAIFKVGEIVAIAQRYSEIGIEPFPFCENGWHNKMFHEQIFNRATSIKFLCGRIKFIRPCGSIGNSPGCGSVLVAYGKDCDNILKNCPLKGKYIKL